MPGIGFRERIHAQCTNRIGKVFTDINHPCKVYIASGGVASSEVCAGQRQKIDVPSDSFSLRPSRPDYVLAELRPSLARRTVNICEEGTVFIYRCSSFSFSSLQFVEIVSRSQPVTREDLLSTAETCAHHDGFIAMLLVQS